MRTLLQHLCDLLLPPRRTDILVRTLTIETLAPLFHEEMLPYHDPRVQALLWECKYYASPTGLELAGRILGERILGIAAEELGTPLLVAVPMHSSRMKKRGHNQAEALCRAALPFLVNSVEYISDALIRTRLTPTQQGLPRAARLTNVAHSMKAVDPDRIKGRVCIVVDDVTTTGATLDEATRALKEAGAARIHTVALARS